LVPWWVGDAQAAAAVRVVRNQEQLLMAQADAAAMRSQLQRLEETLSAERLLLVRARGEAVARR
jgi:hypothetical protein